MKKLLIGIGILCGILFLLLILGSTTGGLRLYNIPNMANEPTLKLGSKIAVSNLKSPKLQDFIVFSSSFNDSLTAETGYGEPGEKYLYRVCGTAGNILQMRNGVLFVNNKNFDDNLTLKNEYRITNKECSLIDEEDIAVNDMENPVVLFKDSAIVNLDKQLIEKYKGEINFSPYIIPDQGGKANNFNWYKLNTNWSVDNFGPIKIPNNCYFVLGDNRHYAQDSRYIGFVKKEDIKGVVIRKF